jgi:hypothetical protein
MVEIMPDIPHQAIYRCPIHGDFVITNRGIVTQYEDCTAIVGMGESKTSLTMCGQRCPMTPLISLIDKKDDIRGLTPPDVTLGLIETVKRLRVEMGESAFRGNRYITQEQIDKTTGIMELEKRLKDEREKMRLAVEQDFEL